MSPNEPAQPQIEPREVWRERETGRLVVIAAAHDGAVSVADPERSEQMVVSEARFRARFESSGGPPLHEHDPDGQPSAIDTATLCGLEQRPAPWLRELAMVTDERGLADLARLVRQALALRGERLGTRAPGEG